MFFSDAISLQDCQNPPSKHYARNHSNFLRYAERITNQPTHPPLSLPCYLCRVPLSFRGTSMHSDQNGLSYSFLFRFFPRNEYSFIRERKNRVAFLPITRTISS